MVRAIAVGNAIINKVDSKKLKSLKDPRCKAQLHEAMNIINECKLNDDGPYSNHLIYNIFDNHANNIHEIDTPYF